MTAQSPAERDKVFEAYRKADEHFQSQLGDYCEKLVRVRGRSGTTISLKLNDEQRFVDQRLEEQARRTGMVRALILKARKRGISTYVQARYYRKTTTRMGQRTFILTHEDEATQNIFGITKSIHDNMAPDYKPRATSDAAHSLAFGGLGGSYGVGTARTKARGRSDTIQNFHGSEVAFWPNAETHAEGILQAVPREPDTEVILESTANGVGGYFYDMWRKAERGEGDYIAIFIPWFWAADLRMDVPEGFDPGNEWREYQDAYGLADEQICWAYMKCLELDPHAEPGTIVWKFRQEYPADANEAFQTGGDAAFIKSEKVFKARRNNLRDVEAAPRVIGVDVAHGGEDKTTIIDRKGQRAGHAVFDKLDTDDDMAIADHVARIMNDTELMVKKCYIDVTGVGAGVYSILQHKGRSIAERVVAVNFAERANDENRYANKRAENWDRMRMRFSHKLGYDIRDDDELHRHVCAPIWKPATGCRYDAGNRLLIELKEKIKERLKFSPDWGDALSLTETEELSDEPMAHHNLPDWAKKLKLQGGTGSTRRKGWMGR